MNMHMVVNMKINMNKDIPGNDTIVKFTFICVVMKV